MIQGALMIYQLIRHSDLCIVLSHYCTVQLKFGPRLLAALYVTAGLNRYTSLAGSTI